MTYPNEVTAYEARDGTVHRTSEEALEHDIHYACRALQHVPYANIRAGVEEDPHSERAQAIVYLAERIKERRIELARNNVMEVRAGLSNE